MENPENGVGHTQIKQWICDLFKNENYENIEVKIKGTSEKDEGFVGDIAFTEVLATKNNTTKQYQMVLKIGKTGETRTLIPVRKAFEREILFYSKLVPTLEQFLKEKCGDKATMDYLPKSLGTMLLEDSEVIFLENLKEYGYDLHERKQPMNLNHLKLTLESYGKYHALSFALQAQNKELFREIFEKNLNYCNFQLLNRQPVFYNQIQQIDNIFREAITAKKEDELFKLYKKWINKEIREVSQEYFERTFQDSVLSHGDCWNNNFMFKYEPDDSSRISPSKVCLLDFQLCKLTSPVADLSYHLYTCAPPEVLSDREEFLGLLKIYHSSLKDNLEMLGSSVENCFPFEKLIEHWKIFAGCGCICSGFILPQCVLNKEDIFSVEEMGQNLKNNTQQIIKEDFKEISDIRILGVLRNFLIITPTL